MMSSEEFLVNLPLDSSESDLIEVESEVEYHDHHNNNNHHHHHTISLIEETSEDSKIFTANANPEQFLTSTSSHGIGIAMAKRRRIHQQEEEEQQQQQNEDDGGDEDGIILLDGPVITPEPSSTIEVDIEVDQGEGDDIIHLVGDVEEHHHHHHQQQQQQTKCQQVNVIHHSHNHSHNHSNEHNIINIHELEEVEQYQNHEHVQVHVQVQDLGQNHNNSHCQQIGSTSNSIPSNLRTIFSRQFEIQQQQQPKLQLHCVPEDESSECSENTVEIDIEMQKTQIQQQDEVQEEQRQFIHIHTNPNLEDVDSYSDNQNQNQQQFPVQIHTIQSVPSNYYDEEAFVRENIAQRGRQVSSFTDQDDLQRDDFDFIHEFWKTGSSYQNSRRQHYPFLQQQYQHSNGGAVPSVTISSGNSISSHLSYSDSSTSFPPASSSSSPPPNTAKYMIYLHDCDSSGKLGNAWTSNLLLLKEKTVEGEFKIYHLNLEEIQTKMAHDISLCQIHNQNNNNYSNSNNNNNNDQQQQQQQNSPPLELWLDCRDSNVTLPIFAPLFSLIGPYISVFSFGLPHLSWAIKIPPQDFSSFLTTYLPNITHLCFNHTMNTTEKSIYTPPLQPPLEKLTILRFNNPWGICFSLITQIIRGAPNLSKIYGYPFIHLKSIASPRHILLLKSFSYPSHSFGKPLPGNQDNFKILGTISSQQYRCSLEELKILVLFRMLKNTESFRTMRNAFSSLLNSSQGTLKKLEIQPLELIGFIDFPIMRELRTLKFNGQAPAAPSKTQANRYKRRRTLNNNNNNNSCSSSSNSSSSTSSKTSSSNNNNNASSSNNNNNNNRPSTSSGVVASPLPILERPNYLQFFPNRYNVNHIFPRVCRVEMAVEIPDEVTRLNCCSMNIGNPLHRHRTNSEKCLALFDEYFPPDTFHPGNHVFPHVRHLIISSYMPLICMERLGARTNGFFPRISTIVLELNSTALSRVLPMIFNLWPGLQRLTCQIDLSIYPSQNLDSVITGIVPGKVEQLRSYYANPTQDSRMAPGSGYPEAIDADVEQYRTLPSILNMKELRVLKFVFDNSWGRQLEEPIISQVTGAYGFRFLPHLQILIDCHENCRQSMKEAIYSKLEPISQYVIFP